MMQQSTSKGPLWPAGHLSDKGGEDSRHGLASNPRPVRRGEPLPLVGRGWGGAYSSWYLGTAPC